MTKQFNSRLPQMSHDQIEQIADEYGLTKTQVLILAIDRLKRQLLPDDNWMSELSDLEKQLISDHE